jgi:acyl carrier protein
MIGPTEKLRQALKGCPDETIRACERFQSTGAAADLDPAILGIVSHHLLEPPARPLAGMPGTTTLVADLGLDSITMVEMAFMFEDVFGTPLPQEELIKVVTLDDLRALVRRHVKLVE